MRRVEIHCDGCGLSWEDKRREEQRRLRRMQQELPEGESLFVAGLEFKPGMVIRLDRPLYWWTVEEAGHGCRTGLMDLCSVECLEKWASDSEVRARLARWEE